MSLVTRTHNREYFYKYMSASTAEIVLGDRTLRWSAPTEFNDPFDVPRELALNLQPSEIMTALTERFIQLIKTPPENFSELKPEIQLIISAVNLTGSDKLIEEVSCNLREMIKTSLPTSDSLDDFREHWRSMVINMRILCLCESYEKTSMWFHYADKYRGVVIEFLCNDDSDSPWRIAKPIDYMDDEPLISTADGWAKLLTIPNDKALAKLFDICMYEKSKDWEYEKEWRVASFKRPNDSGAYTDYKFGEKEIGNLYLGPLIEPDDKEKLIRLSNKYNNMKVIESHIVAGRKLTFKVINGD